MTGVLLGVFAPLIPYLLFTFGVFGWFIGILEAMVAGPLIALGVTHPSGQHDYLGRAEQAVMLLLGILLRPATMILGLLAGTILSFIGLQLLQLGFSEIFNDSITRLIQDSHGLGSLGMFAVILSFILIYTTIALALINRCFSLVYIIPDKLMRWIGAQPEQSMPDSVLEHVKGEISRVVQGVAGSQSQTNIEMTKSASPSAFSYMGGPRKNKK
jgi:defect-in-organelle-trafficking protein DotA